MPEKVNVFCAGLVLLAVLVSSVKLESTPLLAEVKPKVALPESTGSVTFFIVSLASFLLV